MIIYEPTWKSYVVESTEPVFSIDECKEIIRTGKSLPSEDAEIQTLEGGKEATGNKKDYKVRQTNIAWIPFKKAPWLYTRLEHWMHTVNNKHMGFYQLQIGELSQFTMYSKKQHYDWHTDSSFQMQKSPCVRKMSMVLLLNDPKEFKGGAFQVIDKKKTFHVKQGYALFFASFIAHRVLPVTKGNRISLTTWFGGPPLT